MKLRAGVSVIHALTRQVVLLLVILAPAGCEQPASRVAVHGRVVFASGQLLDQGSIEFAPLEKITTTSGGSPIINGEYRIKREQGLMPGQYRVRIYAPTAVRHQIGAPGSLGLTPPVERVAARFNVDSELMAHVLTQNDQRFDFQVE